MEPSETTVRAFIARINSHDVDGIIALCAPDHRFVDSIGQSLTGRDQIRQAWSSYLQLFPDYTIKCETLLASGDSVLLAGVASGTARAGTANERQWRIPAAWRARVRGGLVELWQVYSDNTPVHAILAGDA